MECNKEEAIRAKEMAERRMKGGDFTGAGKLALKAQKLFPDLENISQLITVCEIHCSAQNKLNGSENDWYSVLQIEQFADEGTIKKQYRKLALLLHPDKNKFAGAEAAFKLIGEANRVLTDLTQRSQYDMKCRASVRTAAPKPPSHQSHKNSVANKQYVATKSFPSAPLQFTSLYSHKQAPRVSFWTCCQFCGMRYQYYREHVNRVLLCQSCHRSFTAFDLGAHCVPPGSSSSQFPSQKEFPTQGSSKVPQQSNGGKFCGVHHADRSAGLNPAGKPGSKAELVRGSTAKEKMGGKNVGGRKNDVEMPKPDVAETKPDATKPKPDAAEPKHDGTKLKRDAAKPGESGTSKTTNKRRRKSVEESSESFETGNGDDSEKDMVQGNSSNVGGENSGSNGGPQPRRSLRQKQQVVYKENLSDDDFVSPPLKKTKESRSSGAKEEEMKEPAVDGGLSETDNLASSAASVDARRRELKPKASPPFEESLPNKKCKLECKANGEEAAILDQDDRRSKMDDNSKSDVNIARNSEVLECHDPDFSDFEKDKAAGCIAVNQVWAIYDSTDGMPRFYARVKKVLSPGFKLQITWLESDSDNQDEQNWIDVDLPVACGRYANGGSENTDLLMLSHQMHCVKGSSRGSYFIYPKKGETWALFRDWDISWSSNPETHKPPYQFEFVEVLSDFYADVGIGVAYLGKVKGFVSLFQRSEQRGIVSFHIPPGQMFRFSHRIPSFRMTGKEREGVPVGSFELDPASLPSILDEFSDTGDVKMEKQIRDAEANGSCPKSPKSEVKTMIGSERIHTPKKHEKSNLERETTMLRRSPRGSNGMHLNLGQVYVNQRSNEEDGSKDVSHSNLSQLHGSSSSCQVDDKISTPKKHGKNELATEALKLRRSTRDLSKRNSQVDASQCTAEDSDEHSNANKQENHDCPAQSKGNASLSQSDDKMHLHMATKGSNGVTKRPSVSASVSSARKITEENSFDFKREISEENCQIDQIWALYNVKDGMPRDYVQIKKIEITPDFRLHVALLEACSLPKDTVHPLCCGVFKVKNGKTKVVSLGTFSHRVGAEHFGKNKYEIYPRKGEVWALYKNWSSDSACSDLGECDIVEVLEDNDQSMKLVVLTCVDGSKSLYRSPRIQRSKTGIIDVPRTESDRFSHQIPAFQHTGEKDRLRGFWELDPSAIPGIIILD